MDDNRGEWVNLWMWLVGVVNWKWVWLVGGIYGCGFQEVVWLECIGVVSGCRCKEVFIDFLILLLIPTPLVLALLFSSIPTSLFIFKMFFRS